MTGATTAPYRPTEAPAPIEEVSTGPTLTYADRCDSCGARAYFRFVFEDWRELTFCAHHGRVYAPLLAEKTAMWDESDQLNVRLDVSA